MKKPILTILLVLLLPALSLAATYVVDGVLDGDTIQVIAPYGQQIRVRLYGIDCPEASKKDKPGQAYGNVAKKRVNELIRKQEVELDTYGQDKYGRTIAVVRSGGININETLVTEGYAWVYARYCKESFCRSWKNSEKQAQLNHIGLFAEQNPMPPWVWRHSQR
jgi:endonuclease YncB( thermonuclease family)